VRRLSPVAAGILVLLVASGPASAVARAYGATAVAPADPVKAAEETRAAALFQERFGPAVANVRATKETGDDLALAANILGAAKSQGIDDSYRAYLCARAAELALTDPRGYETAVAAVQMLATASPDKADACNDTIINIRQAQYAAAQAGQEKVRLGVSFFDVLMASGASKTEAGNLKDAVLRYQQAVALAKSISHPGAFDAEQQLAVVTEKARVAVWVAQLANLLKVEPGNRIAGDKMVLAQLVDRDDPAEAAKYLRDDGEASLKKYVPAAARGVVAAPELACVELAEWYRRLSADTAFNVPKLAMLRRADGYYQRYLALHASPDKDRTDADAADKKVQAEIDRLVAMAPGPPWNDCLKLADPARDALTGAWQKTDAGLVVSDEGPGKLALRLMPQAAYELEVKFIRDHGDMVGVALPVGSGGFLASLAGPDGTAREETITGRPDRRNPPRGTQPSGVLVGPTVAADGELHTAVIRVQVVLDQATVIMTLDGKVLPKWTGPARSLTSVEFPAALPPRIWLVTNRAQATFASVRLRVLNGQTAQVPSVGLPAATATVGSALR
jgi:hypothetical protein